jgi:hypothetical protein
VPFTILDSLKGFYTLAAGIPIVTGTLEITNKAIYPFVLILHMHENGLRRVSFSRTICSFYRFISQIEELSSDRLLHGFFLVGTDI